MFTLSIIKKFKSIGTRVHLPLLLFLVVFTMDKVTFKFIGIALILLLNRNIGWKETLKKAPLFYLLILIMEFVRFLLFNKDFSSGHITAYVIGSSYWLMSLLCILQLIAITGSSSTEKIGNTLVFFFWINLAVSLYNLGAVMYSTQSLNPYMLSLAEYGNSTGDKIRGLFMGPSYINMMINAFFLFYFLFRQKRLHLILAAFLIALTTTNFGLLITILTLIICFIFQSNKRMRFDVLYILLVFSLFYSFITPGNLSYLGDSLWPSAEQRRALQAEEEKYLWWLDKEDSLRGNSFANRSGKFKSFEQTWYYLSSGIQPLLIGAGMGNFSSLLAVRMGKVNQKGGSRLFHYLPFYRAPPFEKNNYRIFKRLYSLPKAYHSARHLPDSFVNQLPGEYGLTGIILFIVFYVKFFLKGFSRLSYGKYLLILLAGFLVFEYLFEYLSVVVLFELLMLMDRKNIMVKNIPLK